MFVDTQVRPQGEQVDAVAPAKLKLSQAIRIGAKIRPQCDSLMFSNGKSCALGAAYEANFGYPGLANVGMSTVIGCITALGALENIYPLLRFNVQKEIWERNDHGESRESIAEWLEAQGL